MEMLNPPKPMNYGSGTNLDEQWKKFYQRFELYRQAAGATYKPEEIQVALLLHVMGEEGQEIYNSFSFQNPEHRNNYAQVIAKFQAYFQPRKNLVLERYNFNQAVQELGEEFDHFVTKLKNLAATCEFGDLKDSLIRDRIVVGARDHGVKETLLKKEQTVGPDGRAQTLSLETAINIGRTAEVTKVHLKKMNLGRAEEASVAAVSYNRRGRRNQGQGQATRSSQRSKPVNQRSRIPRYTGRPKEESRDKKTSTFRCKRCGTTHGPRQCPAYGKTCGKCGGWSHYAEYCYSKKVHYMTKEEPTEERDPMFIDQVSIDDIYIDDVQKEEDWIAPIQMKNVIVPLKLDTGAQANVLTIEDFKKIKGVKLNPTEAVLRTYNRKQINVQGKCIVPIQYGSKKRHALFYVCKGPIQSLMGRELCVDLGLVILNLDTVTASRYDLIKEDYKDVFQGLGRLPGKHSIKIDESVPPVVHPCRKIPFPQHKKLKEELEKMEKSGVVKKVEEPTDWVNSLVTVVKPSGALRVCLDPRDLNRAIKREHYKLPSREEVMAKFANKKVFSKLDASQGFWQMELDLESSYLTTFNTPFGRYRYTRLPYGIKSAPEVYHKTINQTFEDLDGVDTSMDDIIIAGDDTESHDKLLIKVLDRVREKNLKLNKEKCQLGVSQLVFLGDLITKNGLRPDPKKVSAIQNMPQPTDVAGVQRFLGMINYQSRWIQDAAQKTEPLRQLIQEKNEFIWQDQHTKAFEELKKCLTEEPVLAFYDPEKPIKIRTDASKNGIGAVLLQLHQEEWKPVAYASRPMTSSEQNYAQIEKELLGIVFGAHRFHQYIYGAQVFAETDHKPLIPLFRKPLADCPIRIQRMMLKLQKYDLDVSYVPGKQLITADTLSRATEKGTPEEEMEILSLEVEFHVYTVLNTMPIADYRVEEVKEETAKDEEMIKLKNTVLSGWPASKSDCDPAVVEYWNVRDELSVAEGLILKGSRIVIPKSLRSKMLKKIHEGHLGIEKCRRRGRESMYWPGLNKVVEEMVKNCPSCLKFGSQKAAEPLNPHEVPNRPWQRVGSDIFTYRNKDYLVITDYYSFYPEVVNLTSTSTKAVIQGMKSVFARHGIPDLLITDNGPQYASSEFKSFTEDWWFEHKTSSPYFPSSNGLAESSVKTVKNLLKKSLDSNGDMYKALLVFRSTPLQCGRSPAQLLMHRRLKSTLPMHHSLLKTQDGEEVVELKLYEKEKQKAKFDLHAKPLPELSAKDPVLMYNFSSGLWDTPAKVVQEVSPRSYIVQTQDATYRRNRRHLTPAPSAGTPDVPVTQNVPQTVANVPQSGLPVPQNKDIEMNNTPVRATKPVTQQASPAKVPAQATSSPRRSTRIPIPRKRLVEEM